MYIHIPIKIKAHYVGPKPLPKNHKPPPLFFSGPPSLIEVQLKKSHLKKKKGGLFSNRYHN